MLDKNKYHLTIVGDGPLKKLIIPRIISRKINGRYQKILKINYHKFLINLITIFNNIQ